MEKENREEITKEEVTFKKSSVSKLTVLVAILAFIIVFLLGVIFAPYIREVGKEYFPKLNIWNEEETSSEDEDENNIEETESTATTEITRNIISAEVPEGWDIIEYTNGNGTDMLVDGITYTGLTGIEILNPEDEVVFYTKAVSGIGFAGCGDYAIFADNNPSYYQEQVDANNEIGETMTEHDYTNTEYSEFEWLGNTMRRIDRIYYYDTNTENNLFEPPCVPSLITLTGISFTDSYGYAGTAYSYGLEDTATEEEISTVDQILESMAVL